MPPKGYKQSDSAKAKISAARSISKVECICDNCGATVFRNRSEVKRRKNVFCNKICEVRFRSGVPRPKDVCDKISASQKGKTLSDEHVENIRIGTKRRFSRQEEREKASASAKNRPSVPDITRMKMSETHKELWSDPEMRAKRVAAITCPENIERLRNGSKRRWDNPDERLRAVEQALGGLWYGKVQYYNIIYCDLWKDVNSRVHAFFDYKCCLCGTPENGHSHIGHHVFYVKEACCWHSEDGIYYTNLNAKDHASNDYCIGENPNYFVILCQKCHGQTNGKFANRKKWADYFRTMIDEEYDGKCYYTKEEMKKVTSSTF